MRRALPTLLCLALPAAAAELPVRAVTLSNAGVMQVERSGPLPPDETITFRAPFEDVDDLLKSLLLRDAGGGQAVAVRLPAQDLEAEAFRGLPLRPADFENRASLLRALRGQAVEAGGATGRLADAEEAEGGLRVSLLTDRGLRLLLLREGEEVRLADPALAARVGRAAEALAASRTADERVVEITLRGATATREVGFAYVAGAPLWKPSWRLVVPEGDGEARLQGWAVVENRSGADWEAVRLSLVSGNPAAFRQALYTPILVRRPELPVRGAEQVAVRADTGARPPPPPPAMAMSAPTPMMAPGLRQRNEAEAAQLTDQVAAVPAAVAASSAGRVAFILPGTVTLRGGETANLPFLEARLPAERLWWVHDLAARNPLNAVRLRNTSGAVLPDGLATVYGATGAEAGGYLGDAELRAVAPNETRILAFARDRDVLLSSAGAASERPMRVELRRGVVAVGTLRREETALAVEPRGARGKLVIDLPRRPGATPRFAVAAEGDFGLRHEAVLDGAVTTLRFAWEREGRQEIPLWDQGLGDPVLLRWREVDVEASLRRLPGGPGTLEALRVVLERLPTEAPGRGALAGLVQSLAETRRLLDAARAAIRQNATAEEALRRARAAAEDRTGAEREEARRRLNAASAQADGWAPRPTRRGRPGSGRCRRCWRGPAEQPAGTPWPRSAGAGRRPGFLVHRRHPPVGAVLLQPRQPEVADREHQRLVRRQPHRMGQRGADGTAMRHHHHIPAGVPRRQPFEHRRHAGLDFGEAFAAGRLFLGGVRPEGVRRVAQPLGQRLVAEALPVAEVLFRQIRLLGQRGFGVAGGEDGGGGGAGAGQRRNHPMRRLRQAERQPAVQRRVLLQRQVAQRHVERAVQHGAGGGGDQRVADQEQAGGVGHQSACRGWRPGWRGRAPIPTTWPDHVARLLRKPRAIDADIVYKRLNRTFRTFRPMASSPDTLSTA